MLQHPIAAHRNMNDVSLFDYCIFFNISLLLSQ